MPDNLQINKVDHVSTANVVLLKTLIETINPLTDIQFIWKPTSDLSSTGKHIRHIIDHYQCFFSNDNLIDYDDRSRETEVEQKVRIAQEKIHTIINLLEGNTFRRSSPLYVLISATPEDSPSPVRSSLIRELLFLQSHTIHHMAVIQMLLTTLAVPIDCNFSLAPSTRAYDIKYKRQASI